MGSSLPLTAWTILATFSVIMVLNGTLWLARRHKNATSGARRAQLTADIAFLRREATKLNTPSTYAKCAKYQRLANSREKELAELTAGPAVPGTAEKLVMLCSAVKVLVLGVGTLTQWEAPVAQIVPRSVAVPLGRFLAFPRGSDLSAFGGVAVAPWLMLLDAATRALARAAFPPLSPDGAVAVDSEGLAREAETTARIRTQPSGLSST